MPNRIRSLAVLCALLLPSLLVGQIGTDASFFGTVSDASGAVVPSAEVTATHLTNGYQKTVTVDGEGNFTILALQVGKYSVLVKAPGFKKWTLTEAELTGGDRVRLSPVLEVGNVAETISVGATAEVIQTEKATLQTVVQVQHIRELPLAIRNPFALVAMAPGMKYDSTGDGGERGTFVSGQGMRGNKTDFSLDGLNVNAPSDNGGTATPNVDTMAEFTVETGTFSAESGHAPIQVKVVTKSGTNELHGTVWEFVQNDAFNARNTYQATPSRVRRNQFGAAVGGPVIKNKTFFFGSYEGTVKRSESIFNSLAVTPAMKTGDFSALAKNIKDPFAGGAPFANNKIPATRIDSASKYFLPNFVEPNSADGYFKANASTYNDTNEVTGRIDHQFTQAQRIYARLVEVRQSKSNLGFKPSVVGISDVTQHNLGLNYTWTMSANTLLSASFGRMSTRQDYSAADIGKQNDAEKAGIQGFPTTGREKWIGPPDIAFGSGWTGASYQNVGGYGSPGAIWGDTTNAKGSINLIRGSHSLVFGGEYGNWRAFASHGSGAGRGVFNFANLYTNDGFGDYLLGLTSNTSRNAPLTEFGNDDNPYVGLFVHDVWRARQNLTFEAGLRMERWGSRTNVNQGSSSWDPVKGKVVAAVKPDGNINMNAFLYTPVLAEASKGLWITAREAGWADNLYEPQTVWGPRLSMVYRPFAKKAVVLRAGYGLFYNTYTGNRAASSINLPYWSAEAISYGASQLQPWESVWSNTSGAYSPYVVYAAARDMMPIRTHEWNVSLQTSLPLKSALTVSYVGTRTPNEFGAHNYNALMPGPHANLQDERPYPRISGTLNIYENMGRYWYHSLQTKIERRFAQGLSFTFSHSFSRSMQQDVPNGDTSALLTGSPSWYNRYRATFDLRQIQYATLVWKVPFGRGRKLLSNLNGFANALLGGWELAFTQQAQTGFPLEISAGSSNLGNNEVTRGDLIGDPRVANPTPARWFNTAAFARPANYAFGNSGLGLVDGPGQFAINTNLSKNFHLTESKYFQFRWETFNTTNRVNYSNPTVSMTNGNFGKITSAGDSRYMQSGLKFLF